MRAVAEVNKYMSDQAPWKLKEDLPRQGTVLHVTLQAVSDCNVLLTPFLPHSAQQVYELLGGTGVWASMPEIRDVVEPGGERPDNAYSVLMGDYDTGARWESTPIVAGTRLATPAPVFRKLEPTVVDEEIARLEPG